MALTPNKDADAARDNMFLREVDDALRQDQMAGIVQNYGKFILIGIVVLLLALGGWFWYRHSQAEAAGVRGEVRYFARAIDDAGQEAESQVVAVTAQ